jgi:UDP-3-O-[3-hydroxymyristoyl] glucosamine N-acyltransferase
MYQFKKTACHASEIAAFLERKLEGDDCVVTGPSSLEKIRNQSVLFIGQGVFERGVSLEGLIAHPELLVIVPEQLSGQVRGPHILSPQPRLDFVRVLQHFFAELPGPEIHPSAVVDPGAVLGRDVFIGPHAHIGSEAKIGDRTRILANVVVSGPVEMGADCVVKANAVIGSEGFSFVTDSENLDHFPQLGRIIIGRNVWVGSGSCIERAAIDTTIIEDDVKIDDLVQVGHNSIIGAGSQITAGTIICGRARVGRRVWIAPNACIDTGVVLGDGAFVGMGAVVLKDVEAGAVVVGNPARFLKYCKDLPGYQ